MPNQSLINYIKRQIANGYEPKAIKENLIRNGYSPKAANEALQAAGVPAFFSSKLIALIIIIIVVAVGFGGFIFFKYTDSNDNFIDDIDEQSALTKKPIGPVVKDSKGAEITEGVISIESVDSSYAIASGETSGFFKTGQEADIMLAGVDFNNAGGSLLFNHQGGIATDGTHLILADRNNNRVLIWNELPEENTEPDIVIGQKNFITNNPGTGLDELNWPVAVATDGTHVIVADTYNDRILIWNSFPAENGQEADIVLETPDKKPMEHGDLKWPWGVWTDGNKLAVTSTTAGQVLIWNQFPVEDYQEPDIVLDVDDLGTPRAVYSDGTHFVVTDHNAFDTFDHGNFFWNSFPTEDDEEYDFFVSNPEVMGGGSGALHSEEMFGLDVTDDGKLLGITNAGLYIWNSFPEDENDAPNLKFTTMDSYDFTSGDGSGIAVAGEQVFISLSNSNKIVVYNTIPTHTNEMPDFSIGSPDIDTNTLATHYFITNPVPVSNGESLFVSSDFDDKLYVWKNLPDESGAYPDFVYSLRDGGWDNELFGNTLVLAGKTTVIVWEELPLNGQEPDIIFSDSIGSVKFQEIKGVALDENYFYLADQQADKIYVWEGIPDKDTEPVFSISTEIPARLSSDGNYLAAIANNGVEIYNVVTLSSNSEPLIYIKKSFNLPGSALISYGHLFVADTGFNSVKIWEDIEDAINGKEPDVILGKTEQDLIFEALSHPEIGKDKIFWPGAVSFDGNYLWVGEFKFSGRLLRFSPE